MTMGNAMTGMNPIRAYAPASVGNFAAGLDLLGAALAPLDGSLLGDVVLIEAAEEDAFALEGLYASALPPDPAKNLVLKTYALFKARMESLGRPCGPFSLTLEKRLPLNSGMGSSASSIVATLAGLQAACGQPFSDEELLELAGQAEGVYSGGAHLDNAAPSLLGGLQLVTPRGARRLPWPEDLLIVLVHPDFELPTARSRAVLPAEVPRPQALAFGENLAGFVHALHTGDRELLRACLRDPLAEPYRAPLLPGFHRAQAAALEAGALGSSFSGSGPSMFGVADSLAQAEAIQRTMGEALAQEGLRSQGWICRLDGRGAQVY
ncbi:homoserine kinase [Holophaga foetida]|uniref:homoserine kinase n=1 Tax=Holophaga foetida TaxID=35839 RepID=UPI0009FDD606|nr:homoserine kinase [Holophaga foetida]